MAVAKTKSQIETDMIAYTVSLDDTLDTSVGSPIRDITIDVIAEELKDAYIEIDAVSKKQSIATPENLSLADISNYVGNWGITRNLGTKATVVVYFETATEPSVDIVIPSGRRVSTIADTVNKIAAVQFKTIAAGRLPFNTRESFFDANKGTYRIGVLCQATKAGTDGNVPTNKLVVLVDSITGVESVTNDSPSAGGANAENKTALANRTIGSYVGGDRSSPPGIFAIVADIDNVVSTRVVGPNSSYLTRNGLLGNAVDVYIRGDDIDTVTNESFIYTNASPTYLLIQQPVQSIISLKDSNGKTYTLNTDFVLVDDTASFGGGRRGRDKISFISGQEPANSMILSVSYSYNKLVKTIQDIFDQEENNITNLDIMIKEAQTINIYVNIKVALSSGVTGTQALPYLESLVAAHINGLNMGTNIARSDIIGILESAQLSNSNVITKVYLPLTEFRRANETAGTINDITLGDFEYPIAFSINVTT